MTATTDGSTGALPPRAASASEIQHETTPEAAGTVEARDAATRAMRRATDFLLARQDAEGWWKGDLETNVTMDAEDLLLRQFLGILDKPTTHAAGLFIRGEQRVSTQYTDPATVCDPGRWPLPPPPVGTPALTFEASHLGEVRRVVRHRAAAAGLASVRLHDLLLAINEAATNTLLHGPGSGTLRVWQEPGSLVCEIRDEGRIDDLLVDRNFPADDDREGGWGFLLVNQLCDLVELRSDAGGTTLRMHMAL